MVIRFNLYSENDSPLPLLSSNNSVVDKYQLTLEECFFNKEKYSDIIFSFKDGENINASKSILSARSSYFNKMFNGKWQESEAMTISIKNVTYK